MCKKILKKSCALLLVVVFVFSTAACGSNSTQNNDSTDTANSTTTKKSSDSSITGDESNEEEITTITVYPEAGNISSGTVGGWKGDYFASRGFEIEIWAYSDEKTNAILASGDLPDVMYIPETSRDVMIESNMLLELDDFLSDMPHAQAYKPLETALNYVREYKSANTGKIYGLPLGVGDSSTKMALVDSTDRHAVKLRWDVYEDIGAPEIKDFDQLIDVMEQMVEALPVDDDGTPFYGTILNSGSDSTHWACMTLFYRWQGYLEKQLPYMLETNMVTGENTSILSKDSLYYKGLQWYNKVNRRGLMDPDSINNDRPTQKAKVDAGYAMIPSGYLPGWAPGYFEYYIPDTNIYYSYQNTYGSNLIGISADSANVEASLKFIDMLCDPDATLVINNGPDGDFWYSDDAGNAFFTDAGLKHLKDGAALGDFTGFELSTGEKLELWNTPWVVGSGANTSYKDGQGNYRIIATTQWDESNEISSKSDNYLKWQNTTGFKSWKDLLNSKDAYFSTGPMEGVDALCTLPDDSMQLTVDTLRDTVVNASWKMVYAESESEFDAIWEEMIAQCEGLGAQEVIDWRLEDIQNAQAIRDSLQG